MTFGSSRGHGERSMMEAMTDTIPASPAPPVPSATSRRIPWRSAAIGLVVVLLVVVGFVVFGSDNSPSTNATADVQLASIRQTCQLWSGGGAPSLGTTSARSACTEMADWMSGQLGSGRMTGPGMWGSAATMGASCQDWIDTDSRAAVAGSSSSAWCSEMVSWMQHHIGNWNHWMMSGSMMDQ